jgi:hypothetical protein
MKRRRTGRWYAALLAVALAWLAGCTLGGVGKEGELHYVAPIEHRLSPGETLPGTEIQYLEKQDAGAQVRIGGQEALRRVGDSLDWQSEPLDGVALDWSLRVIAFSQDDLRVAGTVAITVYDASPAAGEPDTRSVLHYTAPVTLNTKRDQTIPGTTITYLGSADRGAHLGNVEGYAYRKVAD